MKPTPQKGGGLTTGETHDQPLRGDSEIVRGRKSKLSLGGNSHQVGVFYSSGLMKVKGLQRRTSGLSAGGNSIAVLMLCGISDHRGSCASRLKERPLWNSRNPK
jgi:hypothetical protein